MMLDFKLKTGFFKTEQYILAIDTSQLILTPKKDGETHRIVINDNDITTITIIKRGSRLIELEIVSKIGIYIGTLESNSKIDEIIFLLRKEFGRKFLVT